MGKPLRVLVVEDSEDDTLLILREIRHAGYEPTYERVDTGPAMKAALDKREWDLVIADYSMPEFSGLAALALLKELGLDLPFILISGTIGEEAAVAVMKAGANDYVMKDRLARLALAIERELREAEMRRERKRAEEALRESEKKFRDLTEKSLVGVYLVQDGLFRHVNPKFAEVFGYTIEELVEKKGPRDLVLAEDWPIVEENIRKRIAGETESVHYVFRARKKDGAIIHAEVYGSRTIYQGGPAVVGTLLDVTERKRAEEDIRKLSRAVEQSPSIVMITDARGFIEYVNPNFVEVTGYTSEEVIGTGAMELGEQPLKEQKEMWNAILSGGEWRGEFRNRKKNGDFYWESALISPIRNTEGAITHFLKVAEDATERKKAEDEIRRLKEFNEEIVQRMEEGIIMLDESSRITFLNPKALSMLGYAEGELEGEPHETICCDAVRAREHLGEAMESGRPVTFECTMATKDGKELMVLNSCAPLAHRNKHAGFLLTFHDITEWKAAEEAFIEKGLKYDLVRGNLYFSEEPAMERAMDAFLDLLKAGYKGAIITRRHPEELQERYQLKEDTPVYWLGSESVSSVSALPPELPIVEKEVHDFLGRGRVVLIDRLEYLVTQKGFDAVLALVQRLHELAYARKGVILFSLDSATLPAHQLALFRSETLRLERKEGPAIPPDLHEILEFIHGENREGRRPTSKEITKRFGFSRMTCLTKLKQLKALGLIADEQRGRMKLVWVTEKGKELL